ncbi:hypothetical protein L6164_023627 [Bauhinia variegata]|uniref:Uncharacterized protein n=1 Tax=Bauhinia variegata TaxID=167791 RepID=A0ACB9MMA3_BAUVA|nr:hypothetical protein L6164_023627 [Bauhinia variegata]
MQGQSSLRLTHFKKLGNSYELPLETNPILWVLFLKEKLSSMNKETSSISGYLRSLKTIVDELNLIGYPLDNIDLILYYLSGLGFDFKDIVTVLCSQPFSFIYDQIYEQLTNHELQLSREEKVVDSPVAVNNVFK